jgi:hypothetical protein
MLQKQEPCEKVIFGETSSINLFDFIKGFLEENLVLHGWNCISLFDIIQRKGNSTGSSGFGRHGAVEQRERNRVGGPLQLGVAKPYEGILRDKPLVGQERVRCGKCLAVVRNRGGHSRKWVGKKIKKHSEI